LPFSSFHDLCVGLYGLSVLPPEGGGQLCHCKEFGLSYGKSDPAAIGSDRERHKGTRPSDHFPFLEEMWSVAITFVWKIMIDGISDAMHLSSENFLDRQSALLTSPSFLPQIAKKHIYSITTRLGWTIVFIRADRWL
jgi:hypothetical protein